MTAGHTVCIGTIGSGIWRTEDGGQSWANIRDGIWNDSNIYSLTADPTDSRVIYAGTQEGIFRSDDRAVSFRKLEGPLDNYQVWAIAVDPSDPNTVMAGCGPSAFFRTRDAGRTWEKMNVPLAESCPNVREPRATALVIDPNDSRIVWAGIEVDGVRRSLDGGDSWTAIGATAMGEADTGEGIWDPDIHDIVVTRGAPSMVITSTPKEIFTSTDLGESWNPLKVKESFPTMYCRPMALKENDSKVLFVGNGDGPFGDTGSIQRSKDQGQTWETCDLPVEPNTGIWRFATHASDPDMVYACSHFGQVYASHNGGDSWNKLRRDFGEIWTMTVTPN